MQATAPPEVLLAGRPPTFGTADSWRPGTGFLGLATGDGLDYDRHAFSLSCGAGFSLLGIDAHQKPIDIARRRGLAGKDRSAGPPGDIDRPRGGNVHSIGCLRPR